MTPKPRPGTQLIAPERDELYAGLRVHSAIGEGAMGRAYLVAHPILRAPSVLKIFKQRDHTDVFSEAHLAARVRSPHVVDVLDAGHDRHGQPFLVVQYVDGIDLEELRTTLLRCGLRLPYAQVARMLAQAARGLHAIHQAGILHRDIKPANLFLAGDGTVQVGDLGVAVESLRARSGSRLTGTPLYMAPELWNEDQERASDRRADLYSLGATGHALATGSSPFDGPSILEIARAHLEQEYAPEPVNDPVGAYLFAVLKTTLEKHIEHRPHTAEHVARALERVAEPCPRFTVDGPRRARFGALTVQLVEGDITAQECDVIVSAANVDLHMKEGVAAQLARVGGRAIEAEATSLAPARMGDVVWTGPGRLRCKWIAHTVSALGGAVCLQRATLRTLLGAEERAARSVVFPALGTGVAQVPIELAAHLILQAMTTFAAFQPTHVRELRVVLYGRDHFLRWSNILSAACGEEKPSGRFTGALGSREQGGVGSDETL